MHSRGGGVGRVLLRTSRDRAEERQDEQDEGCLVLGPMQAVRAVREPVSRVELQAQADQ